MNEESTARGSSREVVKSEDSPLLVVICVRAVISSHRTRVSSWYC